MPDNDLKKYGDEYDKAVRYIRQVKDDTVCAAYLNILVERKVGVGRTRLLRELESNIAVRLELEAEVQEKGGYKETADKIRYNIIPQVRRELEKLKALKGEEVGK